LYEPTLRSIEPNIKDQARMRAIMEAIKRAQYRDIDQIDLYSDVPPGRLLIQEAVQRDAQLSLGVKATAKPWKETRRREVDNPPITLAVATDISSSMSEYQMEVSSFTWAVSKAVRNLSGSVGAVAWNANVYNLMKPNMVKPVIDYYNAIGGSTGLPKAIQTLDGLMNLSFGSGVRLLVVITDGHLPNADEIQYEINQLVANGVIILWINTDYGDVNPKNSVIAHLNNTSDFGKIVGSKIVEALNSI
jgi:hypothetical protein